MASVFAKKSKRKNPNAFHTQVHFILWSNLTKNQIVSLLASIEHVLFMISNKISIFDFIQINPTKNQYFQIRRFKIINNSPAA